MSKDTKTVEERIREAAEEGKRRFEEKRQRVGQKLADMAQKRAEEIAKGEQRRREIAEFNSLPVETQHNLLTKKRGEKS